MSKKTSLKKNYLHAHISFGRYMVRLVNLHNIVNAEFELVKKKVYVTMTKKRVALYYIGLGVYTHNKRYTRHPRNQNSIATKLFDLLLSIILKTRLLEH